MKVKKVPLRKCLGCNEMKPKKELIRVVHNSSGETKVDTTGRAHGRGAYICNSKECFSKAKQIKAFNRAFQTNIPDQVYDDLARELEGNEG